MDLKRQIMQDTMSLLSARPVVTNHIEVENNTIITACMMQLIWL